MTTSVTTAGTTMRAIIQERYGEAENVLRLGQAGLAPAHDLDGPGGMREGQSGGHGGDFQGAPLGAAAIAVNDRAPASTAQTARPRITAIR
jgi:hypothetical protein